MEEVSREKVVGFRQDIRELLKRRVAEAVEVVLKEELAEVLGTTWYERSAVRRGYRNGSEERLITTSQGTRKIEVPRGRVAKPGGKTVEFRSQLLLRLAPSEASANWSAVIVDLQRRALSTPALLVIDGHQGLGKALDEWKGVKVQRCTVHKLRNLIDACPVHARREMQRDYQRITHAADGLWARKAYETFLAKWSQLCPPVARSLEEAGQELLTFYEFPKAMWKSLRSTPNTTGCTANAIENLNREFRRRTKTQASFSTEEAGITLLYGLIAFGQIQLNKIQGFRDLVALGGRAQAQAA